MIWDLATGAPQRRLTASSGPITALAYCPDGSLLASANGFESYVRIWDLNSGQVKHMLRSYAPARNSVAFAPNGRLVAASDHDGSVKLWSARGPAGCRQGWMDTAIGSAAWPSRPTVEPSPRSATILTSGSGMRPRSSHGDCTASGEGSCRL